MILGVLEGCIVGIPLGAHDGDEGKAVGTLG
jgi:hypothetical protein